MKSKSYSISIDASPKEKYDNLLLAILNEWQGYVGHMVNTEEKLNSLDPNYYGFKNTFELAYFINSLVKDGLLNSDYQLNGIYINNDNDVVKSYYEVTVSYSGLRYCASLLETGKNSTKCFVAMKFNENMSSFYEEGIFKAINSCGFYPIRVDKEHAENEQTINDFIISSIKQSRFCVADLTYQSQGVYFEAGFALGRGLPVIYTCYSNDFENIHFDLKPMQILQYSSEQDLFEALKLKIQAVILD